MEETTVSTEQTVDAVYQSTNTQQIDIGTDSGESLLSNEETENLEESPSVTEEETPQSNTSELNTQIEQQTKAFDTLAKDLKSKGFNFNDAVKEYNEFGALSDTTMANLAKAGYPKEVVESFIQSRQVLENQFTKAVLDSVGGESEYNKIISWAGSNLPESVVKSFNKAIDNNNLEAISLMLEGIKSKMVAKQGTRNPSIIGGASTSTPSKGYSSKSEMIKAMSDPRYGKDPAYMREVERKMLYTKF